MRDEPLPGGNMNHVVRRGDAVVRDAGPWTPTVHRLLRHLRRRGFTAAPMPLGEIEAGREALTWMPGEVPLYPLPDWVWRTERLVEAARLLRGWHDASLDFDRDGAVWQGPARAPAEVVCHGDFAPHNLVFDVAHRAVGIIDVDFAAPGPRVRDLAHLALRMLPLTTEHAPAWFSPSEARARLNRLVDAYGEGPTAEEVLAHAQERLLELAEFSDSKADELAKPELHADARGYRADADWLAAMIPVLRSATVD